MPCKGSGLAAPSEIVGRDEELAAVECFLDDPDGATVLLVEGEAGIGKTTVWNAAVGLGARRSFRLRTCRAANSEARLSYAVLGDLIDTREELAGLPPPQRRPLEVALLLAEPGPAAPEPRAIGVGVLGLLRRLSEEAPLLVAIDDAQWVDPASAAALDFAVRRLRDEPVRVVVAVRPGGGGLDLHLPPERLQRVELGPLSLGALQRLVRSRLGAPLTRSTLERVHGAAAGNPFYALEIARSLRRAGVQPEHGQPLPVPADVRELVRERIATLPGGAQEVLEIAAVEPGADLPMLRAVTGHDDLTFGLEAARLAGVIELSGDRIVFDHPLLASAVYERLLPEPRRRLHRRLADAVSDPEHRARHLALGADGPDASVAAVLDEAAARAAARGAPSAAAELSELAVRLTPEAQQVDQLRRRSDAAGYLLDAGDALHARPALESLIGDLAPGHRRAEALLRLATTREDDLERMEALCEQAVSESDGDDALLARINLQLSEVRILGGDVSAALERALAAVEASERAGGPALLASSLAYVGFFESELGRMTPGLLDRAIELERQAGYLAGYKSPSFVKGYALMSLQEDFDLARLLLEETIERARAHGDEQSRIVARFHLAELGTDTGAWDEALRHGQEALEGAELLDLPGSVSAALAAMSLVHAMRGDSAETRATAERALAVSGAAGNEIFAGRSRAALGYLDVSLGNYESALERLGPRARQIASGRLGRGPYRTVANAVEALVATGRLADTEELLEWLEQVARTTGRPTAIECAARSRAAVLAAAGDLDEALAILEDALPPDERAPDPFEHARSLLAYGTLLRRARRRRDARDVLRRALEAFEHLRAPPWIERTRGELARISGRGPATDALTETERRVAALVAEGRTNKEVAAALHVTVRTVETHLSHIYAKVGVRSRTELARHVARPTGS